MELLKSHSSRSRSAALLGVGLAVVAFSSCRCGGFRFNDPDDGFHAADLSTHASARPPVRQQPFYRAAAEAVSRSQDLNQRLGSPIAFGDPEVKDWNGEVDQGSAVVTFTVKGPTGSGKIQIKVTKAQTTAPWVSAGGDFFADQGPPIHIR